MNPNLKGEKINRSTGKVNVIPPILEATHRFLKEALLRIPDSSKRLAIDTTIGNGFDTCALARMVEADGSVIGCDIQDSAIQSTTRALENEGLGARVRLLHCGHERLHEHLPTAWKGEVAAITANLGYLPRGDKTIMTKPVTTRRMIETLLPYLRDHGVMTIVAYGGHAGGQEEVDMVHTILSELPQREFRVLRYAFINQIGTPPILYVIERTCSL
jgi:hypothetical protein